jgi:hypothetical protein
VEDLVVLKFYDVSEMPRTNHPRGMSSSTLTLPPLWGREPETLVFERRVEDLVVLKFCDASEMPRTNHPRGISSSTLTLPPLMGEGTRVWPP